MLVIYIKGKCSYNLMNVILGTIASIVLPVVVIVVVLNIAIYAYLLYKRKLPRPAILRLVKYESRCV